MSKALTKKKARLRSHKEGEDVLLSEEKTVYLIDTSGSMEYCLGATEESVLTKCQAVRRAMKEMLKARLAYPTADHVAIVEFGTSGWGDAQTRISCELRPVTAGGKHFRAAEGISANACTPMYQGFEKAAEVLASSEGLVRIVMMSDGEPNAGYDKADVVDLVTRLSRQYGFVIDTVGIGIPGATSTYDERFMKLCASRGAGQFFPIEDVDALVKMLRQTSIERQGLIGSGVKLLGEGTELTV